MNYNDNSIFTPMIQSYSRSSLPPGNIMLSSTHLMQGGVKA